jgi:hypothetical protein
MIPTPPKRAKWEIRDEAAAEQRKLLAAGFLPIPCSGKIPVLAGWQDIRATDELISKWAREHPDAMNVGVLCRTTPCVDIDILDPDVAAEVEGVVFDVVGEKAAIRFGQRPKRAIMFRAEKSFTKMVTPKFISPSGDTCKVEVLGNGQQVVTFGTHPDTGQRYVWHGELGAYADLPVLTAEMAQAIVDKSTDIMRSKGWPEVTKPSPNGATLAAATDATVLFDATYGSREQRYAAAALVGSVSELAAMPKDSGRNDALNAISYRIGRMIARGWIERNAVELELFKASADNGLVKEDGARAVRKTIASGIGDGLTVPHDDLADMPTVKSPPIVPKIAPPRVITFTRFADITLSKAPRYIVKGLIPAEGLVVFWGPPKCAKSFKVFDIVAHVAAGWDYRGRRVKQCGVAYCALEGQLGFQARVEAFRQAHGVGDIPLRVSGDRLLLPSDVTNIIKSIQDQFETPPGIVVLDTLNRSLEGSENDPADMGRYVQAADAIREAFKCVVIIVHHCGIDGTRPRGHTSLTGAADTQVSVRRDDDGNVIAKVEWMKDGAEGDEIVSRLEVRNVGNDEDGEEITSCVVRSASISAQAKPREPKLTPNQKTMFMILHGAGRSGLLTEEWNELGKKAGVGIRRRADLTDAQNGLKTKGLVRVFNDRWHVNHNTSQPRCQGGGH